MQSLSLFNSVQFFNNKRGKRGGTFKNPHITYLVNGDKTKNSNYTFNFSRIIKSEKLDWEFVKVGSFGSHLILTKGNAQDGIFLSKENKVISSKALMADLLEFLKIPVPTRPNERLEVYFNFEKIDTDIYLLKKI
jgi:hypothetical protein